MFKYYFFKLQLAKFLKTIPDKDTVAKLNTNLIINLS